MRLTKMDLQTPVMALLIACAAPIANAQEQAGATRTPARARIFIEPSSASLTGGNARLTTTALSRKAGAYVGDYHLKVTPYFFKSEKGKLFINVSDESLRRLINGNSVEVTGQATTSGTAETRAISARATPLGSDRGSLTVAILTENGKLVFNSSYRFAEK